MDELHGHGQHIKARLRMTNDHEVDILVAQRFRAITLRSLLEKEIFQNPGFRIWRPIVTTIAWWMLWGRGEEVLPGSVFGLGLFVVHKLGRPGTRVCQAKVQAQKLDALALGGEHAGIVGDVECLKNKKIIRAEDRLPLHIGQA